MYITLSTIFPCLAANTSVMKPFQWKYKLEENYHSSTLLLPSANGWTQIIHLVFIDIVVRLMSREAWINMMFSSIKGYPYFVCLCNHFIIIWVKIYFSRSKEATHHCLEKVKNKWLDKYYTSESTEEKSIL